VKEFCLLLQEILDRPIFTISIGDMHVDEKDDVTWTCEAFGIPDVRYEWMKNGKAIVSSVFTKQKNPVHKNLYIFFKLRVQIQPS